jgi:NAD(P)H-dependent FMN reductase
MLRLAVIIGSTRPGRVGEAVARWVHECAQRRGDAEFELVDIEAFGLPLLDEPVPAALSSDYVHDHTRRWSETVAGLDGFVFVTPEHNHSVPASLKNAIDFLYAEWNDKAAGFVGYGSAGGVRAVEHLRLVLAEVQVATVRNQVMLSLREDFEDYRAFKPREFHEQALGQVFDQVIAWAGALRPLRESRA